MQLITHQPVPSKTLRRLSGTKGTSLRILRETPFRILVIYFVRFTCEKLLCCFIGAWGALVVRVCAPFAFSRAILGQAAKRSSTRASCPPDAV
jgi:hypothetical protein